jgi:SAM-dependent methyltransferase
MTEAARVDDTYAATAVSYDLLTADYLPAQRAVVDALVDRLDPARGPVVDIGAGTGQNAAFVLDRSQDAAVLAIEPSESMRSGLEATIAARPEWGGRIEVRPERIQEAELPDAISGAIMLGVIGHLEREERLELFARLGRRLPTGGELLFDLQEPIAPARVEPYDFTVTRSGDHTHRGIAEGWPVGGEVMRWRMRYLILDGDRVVREDVAEHDYRHPLPDVVAAQADLAGFDLAPAGEARFFRLRRRP